MMWLPSLGWQPVSDKDVAEFELDASHAWEVFCIEWFGFGIALYARPCA